MLEASYTASGDGWKEGTSHMVACRAMLAIEEFGGDSVELIGGTLTLRWAPSQKLPDGKEKARPPA